MAVLFLDSNALVKRYVDEVGSHWVNGLVAPRAGNLLYVARIVAVEVVAALRRRTRTGGISPADADAAIARFRRELLQSYVLIDISPAVVDEAMLLADRLLLRGYDAVQLAAALQVERRFAAVGDTTTLISADHELNVAAQAEGLTVENPNDHP